MPLRRGPQRNYVWVTFSRTILWYADELYTYHEDSDEVSRPVVHYITGLTTFTWSSRFLYRLDQLSFSEALEFHVFYSSQVDSVVARRCAIVRVPPLSRKGNLLAASEGLRFLSVRSEPKNTAWRVRERSMVYVRGHLQTRNPRTSVDRRMAHIRRPSLSEHQQQQTYDGATSSPRPNTDCSVGARGWNPRSSAALSKLRGTFQETKRGVFRLASCTACTRATIPAGSDKGSAQLARNFSGSTRSHTVSTKILHILIRQKKEKFDW